MAKDILLHKCHNTTNISFHHLFHFSLTLLSLFLFLSILSSFFIPLPFGFPISPPLQIFSLPPRTIQQPPSLACSSSHELHLFLPRFVASSLSTTTINSGCRLARTKLPTCNLHHKLHFGTFR